MQNQEDQLEGTIEALRGEVDQVHRQIQELFLKRLDICEKIWTLKQAHNKPFFDESRETKIIHQFDQEISCPHKKSAVQKLFRVILDETRIVLKGPPR